MRLCSQTLTPHSLQFLKQTLMKLIRQSVLTSQIRTLQTLLKTLLSLSPLEVTRLRKTVKTARRFCRAARLCQMSKLAKTKLSLLWIPLIRHRSLTLPSSSRSKHARQHASLSARARPLRRNRPASTFASINVQLRLRL